MAIAPEILTLCQWCTESEIAPYRQVLEQNISDTKCDGCGAEIKAGEEVCFIEEGSN